MKTIEAFVGYTKVILTEGHVTPTITDHDLQYYPAEQPLVVRVHPEDDLVLPIREMESAYLKSVPQGLTTIYLRNACWTKVGKWADLDVYTCMVAASSVDPTGKVWVSSRNVV